MNNFSESNFSALLKIASAKLGVSEAELKNAVESGNFDGIKGLDSDKLNKVIKNDELKEQLVSSPQAQEIIKKFLKK
jgi:hypothetical protein